MSRFRSACRTAGIYLALGLFTAVPAWAEETDKPDTASLIDESVMAQIRDVLANDIVRISIAAQNDLRGALSQAQIDALDQTWRREREEDRQPLIAATLASPLSVYLLRQQAGSLGLFSEIFVMDANGLNVGQSSITSDYWQGDEAKFQKTFPQGRTAIFVDEPEWHDATKTWRAQVNLTVVDPDVDKPIGAATFEINLTELARRRGA